MTARRNLVAPLILVLLAMPLCTGPAAGDGIVVGHNVSDAFDRWGFVDEDTQFGLISYSEGTENMILSIKVTHSQLTALDQAVWIYPIPSNPRNVTIGGVGEVSAISGTYLESEVEDAMGKGIDLTTFSQVYPFILSLFVPVQLNPNAPFTMAPRDLGTGATGGNDSVEIFQTFQGYGLTTELTGTNSSSGLRDYLAGMQLSLPSGASGIIDEYVGKDCSFVISRISNMTEFLDTAPVIYDYTTAYYSVGVAVSFSTDQIFYPLRLTSTYGNAEVPMLIQVIGHVSPRASAGRMHIEPHYMVGRAGDLGLSVSSFLGTSRNTYGMDYTELVFDSRANLLTDDLWMDDSQPLSVGILKYTKDNSWAVALPIFALSSIVSSLLSTLIVFWGNKPQLGRAALLGLFNFTTLIGLGIAARHFIDRRILFRDVNYLLPEHPVAGYLTCFTLLFLLTVVLSYLGFFALV